MGRILGMYSISAQVALATRAVPAAQAGFAIQASFAA
jgi:hypothetical protein